MSHSINSCNHDIIGHVFTFLENREKVAVALTCTTWKEIAFDIFKLMNLMKGNQIENDAQQKMPQLLKENQKTVADYCPILKEYRLEKKHSILDLVRIYNQLNNLVEKYFVFFDECFTVDPKSIPLAFKGMKVLKQQVMERSHFRMCPADVKRIMLLQISDMLAKEDRAEQFYAGRSFISLKFIRENDSVSWDEDCSRLPQLGDDLLSVAGDFLIIGGKVQYFPIDFFNLKIEGEDCQLIGDKTSGNYCIPLKGRLIEFVVIPCPENHSESSPSLFTVPTRSIVNTNHGFRSVNNYNFTETLYDPEVQSHAPKHLWTVIMRDAMLRRELIHEKT